MIRRKRYLRHNASSEIPSNLLFVDTEAYIHQRSENHTELTLRLWCSESVRIENAKRRNSEQYFGTSADQFWQLVEDKIQPKKPLWILAHNAAYDMKQLLLWEQFDNYRLVYRPRTVSRNSGIMAIDHKPWFVKCHHKTGATIWIVDTCNYWNVSLSELGLSLSLPKKEIDLVDASLEQLRSYCERDVEIIKIAFCNLIEEWKREGLGNFRTSAAGLSIQNFRHWHVDSTAKKIGNRERFDVLSDPDSPEIAFERDGFFGGRIEAFYYGTIKEPIYHVDVQSMYPSVMSSGYFPINRVALLENQQPENVLKLMPAQEVMAEVLINSKYRSYPLRYNKRQIHATGKFWTVLCSQELYRALSFDDVQQVSRAVVYKTAPIFRQWVDYWWKTRKEANRAKQPCKAGLAKLILNSLHGKFAQRGTRWQDSKIEAPRISANRFLRWGMFTKCDADTGESQQMRVLAGQVQEQVEGKPPEHCFPAISAVIASLVRERLRELIEICPEKSVLYTAVDSMIVTEAGLKALLVAGEISEGTLGKLKVIGEHNECEIRSQGCYRLDDHWTACGLWGRAEMDYRGQWTAQTWSSNLPFNFDLDGTVTINRVSVNAPRANPKGEMLLDGWTKPFAINKTDDFFTQPIEDQRKQLFEG